MVGDALATINPWSFFIFKTYNSVIIMSTQPRQSRTAICNSFNLSIKNLIRRLESKSRSDDEIANIDRLKRRISLIRSTVGDSVILGESSPFFLKYADIILNPDRAERDKFFMNLDAREEYAASKFTPYADEFMFELVDSIKAHYKALGQKERDEIYNEIKSMLACCIEFDLLQNL
jgi:hypothetical protein